MEKVVQQWLLSLNTIMSPGSDGLHPHILKGMGTVLARPLHLIFRDSMENGKVPADWCRGNVVPVLKKGSDSESGN